MKKKILSIFMGFILCFGGLSIVNATNMATDSNNNISFPDQYTESSVVTITGLNNYTLYYQVVKVDSGSTLDQAISSYFSNQAKLNSITDTNSNEYLEAKSASTTFYNEIVTNTSDPVTSNWKTTTDGKIYDSNVVTNTTTGKYIVWVKVVVGTNTIYDFAPYSFDSSTGSNTVTNPTTGINNTYLYIGVGVLILIGSYLVVNKNKEKYE